METKNTGNKRNFTIVSNREIKHRGFGAGILDLNSVSSIIIDGDEAYLDMDAMHARSKVERRIRFSTDKASVPNGRTVWIVWVAVDHNEEGSYYAGVTACEMLIDTEARKGWKLLVDHVNRMDAAMKRKVMVDELNEQEKATLKQCLIDHHADWWERSDDTLKQALS